MRKLNLAEACKRETINTLYLDDRFSIIHNTFYNHPPLNFCSYDGYLIFKDNETSELFKLDKSELCGCNVSFSSGINEEKIINTIRNNCSKLKTQAINDFLSRKGLNIELLPYKCDRESFMSYIRSCIKDLPSINFKIDIGTILFKALENNEIFTQDSFNNEFLKLNNNLDIDGRLNQIDASLEKNFDRIYLKYLLLKLDRLVGTYDLKFLKYNGNNKSTTFDMIDIEIRMCIDLDRTKANNRAFIKNNLKDIKRIIKLIITTDRKIKKYAGYLKYDSLVLDCNTLVAKFVFKDKLEKLLEENN